MPKTIIADPAILAQEIIQRIELAAHAGKADTMALGASVAAHVATWFAAEVVA